MTSLAPASRHQLRLDYTSIPFTDIASKTVLETAVLDLTLYRGGPRGDSGATISVLVSLIAEAQELLVDAIADARDQGYSWSLIATRLATTVPAARHRYAADSNWRRRCPRTN
jgi:hypothetical protein